MQTFRPIIFYSVLAGVLQISVGAIALMWAWPLFGDPPFLGNGVTREYWSIHPLLAGNSAAAELLPALKWKLDWLFERHSEGVLIVLALGITMLLSGVASLVLGAWSAGLVRTRISGCA